MVASAVRASALRVVVAAVWSGRPMTGVGDDLLREALGAARRNQVEGLLLDAYPGRLPAAEARLARARATFDRNLAEAAALLAAAGVRPVLIKADEAAGREYGDFDLVVGDDGWERAQAALSAWAATRSSHLFEPGKVLLRPAQGPAAHLHRSAGWFGIPVLPTDRLWARSMPASWQPAVRVPGPADALRLVVAHAVFQNLAFDLSELATVRRLSASAVIAEAHREAAREGWAGAFAAALAAVGRGAVPALDRVEPPPLPFPLPVGAALAAGLEHGWHLVRGRAHAAGLWELLLRPALVAAKRRRAWAA